MRNSQIIGDVAIGVGVGQSVSALVQTRVTARRFLPTTILVTPIDAFGQAMPSHELKVVPQKDDIVVTEQFFADAWSSLACRHQLSQYGVCRVAWQVSVLDHNHMMIENTRTLLDHR
jgi:hypothetical protein